MDTQDLRTLKLFEEIENNQYPSQRYLAQQLNVSLGLANAFIKRLAQKGYFKITTIPRNRMKYILTAKGVAEKTRLTYEYIQFSFQFYQHVRSGLRELYKDMVSNDIKRVAFYGANEVAEIAYISLQETPIELVAVIDDSATEKHFFQFVIADSSILKTLGVDRILITELEKKEEICTKLLLLGIPEKKILALE